MLTKQQALENHRKMWTWISEQTIIQKYKVSKRLYFSYLIGTGQIKNSDIPMAGCYCCEYAMENKKHAGLNEYDRCIFCFLQWNVENCFDTGSYYAEWEYTPENEYEHAAELALKIANLPVKGE